MSISEQLKTLRSQADKLGIDYHHKNNEETIRALIGAELLANPARAGLLLTDGEILEAVRPLEEAPKEHVRNLDYVPESADDFKLRSQKAARLQIGALKRIQFTNMNHNKKGWPGEMISVGSARLGTYKKYVFFNGEPYHVPKIVYDAMKERQCSSFYTVSRKRGGDIRKSKLINEYAIVDLDPLTPAELKDLADRQQLSSVGL